VRVAVVDIGTNSTRLLVAEVDPAARRVTAELARESVVTRLGQGVDATGALAPEAMERVFAVLDRYRALIDAHGVDATTAVLTSAVRDASNGPAFTETVRTRYGLEARRIPGELEARLTFLGATSERADPTAVVVIDIGGGSTEFVVGGHRRPEGGGRGGVDFFTSVQAGVVRMSERHLHTDPPRPAELAALADDVRAVIAAGVPPAVRGSVDAGIAVAGTATQSAAIALALEPYDPTRVHGHVLEVAVLDDLLGRLAALPEAERRAVPGLHPDRAPTIVAGVLMLAECARAFGLERVEVSEHDILRGAALDRAADAAAA
jgi:exopolyphosphatase/guanosine-5'-triphosphate,3'-diphosphate pyrophosphatase